MEWINVHERLPNNDREVLIFDYEDDYYLAEYDEAKGCFINTEDGSMRFYPMDFKTAVELGGFPVDFWAELPKAPERVPPIKPCPFCGSPGKLLTKDEYETPQLHYDVQCTSNDCYLEYGADWNFSRIKDAVDTWNKRRKS